MNLDISQGFTQFHLLHQENRIEMGFLFIVKLNALEL